MNCHDFETLLSRLQTGPLPDAAMRHLELCTECHELAQLAGFVEGWPHPPAARDFVNTVISQTSGSPCRQAERQLNAFLAESLDPQASELLQLHLDHCPACTGLAAALAQLEHSLPRLATLDPGPGFVDAVLAATLPMSVRLRRWWFKTWPRWVHRPRFSVELAYVATLIVVLASGMPWSPAGAMPRKVAELVRIEPVHHLQERVRQRLSPPANELNQRLKRRLATLKASRLVRRMAELPPAAQRSTRLATERGWSWGRAASRRIGTFLRWSASRLMKAEEFSSSTDTLPTNQPTTPPTQPSEESPDERIQPNDQP